MNKDKKVQQIIFIEGSYNVLVLILKLMVGISTHSLAILGDVIHSLTDVLNNVVIWIVMRMSAKPADKNHPYGHRKIETMAVFVMASVLVVLAVELILHALRKESTEVVSEFWGLILMVVVLVLNISVSLWERFWAKKLDSNILHADAQHTFVDAMTTVFVIISWQLSAMGYFWLDQLCAIVMAGLVLYFAFELFQKVVPILIDGYSVESGMVEELATSVDGVMEVRQVRSRWIGDRKAVDMIIAVDAQLSIGKSHEIAHAVEDCLVSQLKVADVTIHVEPFVQYD